MKRVIPFVVLTLLAMGCGGDSSTNTPAEDTATPDTATPDTATPDTATPDTATPDTATPPDVTLPPPSDTVLPPPPDSASGDTAGADAEPSGPVTSCRLGLDCALECKNDECKSGCTADADTSIVDGVTNVMTCQTEQCSSNNDVPCVLDKCYDSFAACYFDGTAGDDETGADCKDTKNCVEESCNDDECVDTCLQSATAQAQKDYVKLYFCVHDFCKSNPNLSEEDCKKNAEQGICGTQWAFCFDF